jgi:YesN/AraC family two-component response regulator
MLTIFYVNSQTSNIVKVNQRLVESQLELMEENKRQEATISQQSEQTTQLLRDLSELKEQLRAKDVVAQMCAQAEDKQPDLKQLQSMSDEVLLAWVDERMESTHMFCEPNLTLKIVANRLGLTQKRLQQIVKNDSRYKNLSEYLNEKRFQLACCLLRDVPQWTIEAVAKEVGFSNRLMLHEMMKKRIGLTPAQYRDKPL